MRTRARRIATVAIFGVLTVAGIGSAVQPAAMRDAGAIPPQELRSYPPILVGWGDAQDATQTATGDVYVVKPNGSGVRRLLSWPDRIRDRQVYGARAPSWSPHRRQGG